MAYKLYTNIWDIFIDAISDIYWLKAFTLCYALWFIVQKICESIFVKVANEKQKARNSKEEFAEEVITTIHAFIMASISFLVIWRYINLENEALMEQIEEDSEGYIHLYKQISILSSACFVITAIDWMFRIPNASLAMRIGFVLHHIVAIMALVECYPTHSVFTYLSALTFQVEFSTIPLNLKYFAKVFENKDLYWFGGVGLLLTYPLQRIFILAYTIYVTMSLKEEFLATVGIQGYYFGLFCMEFILVFSAWCCWIMFKNPKKQIYLKVENDYDLLKTG